MCGIDCSTLSAYNYNMVSSRGIEWAESADRHGYTLDDVVYAARHITGKLTYVEAGETYVKFTGLYHGNPVVPSIEVVMKLTGGGTIVVFHVNAEQSGFLDRRSGKERNHGKR